MSEPPFSSTRLDVKGASLFTGMKVSTLNHWRGTGEGPVFVKSGSRVFYPLECLVEFINARRCRSTAEARRKLEALRKLAALSLQLGTETAAAEVAGSETSGPTEHDSAASSMA